MYNKKSYPENVFKRIKSILGDFKSFIKSNKGNRRSLQKKIEKLSLIIDFGELNDLKIENIGLNREVDKFTSIFNEKKNLPITRKDSADFNNKLKIVSELIKVLMMEIGSSSKEDNNSSLDPEIIFYLCVSTMLSSIKENSEFGQNNVKLIDLFSRFQRVLIVYLSISHMSSDKYFDHVVLYSHNNHIGITSRIPEISDLTFQIIDLVNHSLEANQKSIVKKDEFGRNVTIKIIEIPEKIMKVSIPSCNLPSIIEPDLKYDKTKDYLRYMIRVKNGLSSLVLSDDCRNALIITQNKKFKINKKAIDLFERIDNLDYKFVKDLDCLPFTPISHLEYLREEIENYEKVVKQELIDKIVKGFIEIKEKKIKNVQEYFEGIGISKEDLKNSTTLRDLRKDFKTRNVMRKTHNTIIEFSKIYLGFPIYYTNSLDYRGRMYPWQNYFSRTTGIYKYLLMEYEERIINDNGFKCIEQVIKGYEDLELEDVLIKDSDSFFYKILVLEEFKLLKNNRKAKSGIMIEIDQKSSSSVLTSLVLNDLELAKKSNLIGKENMDPPGYLMVKSFDWFKDKISEDSLEIISKRRDLHKYLLMCYFYNETNFGRNNRLREYLESYEDSSKIASLYPDFINHIFTSLNNKRRKLNEMIKFYLSTKNEMIKIRTLDGCLLKWTVYKRLKVSNKSIYKKKYKDPISNKYVNYESYVRDVKKVDNNKIISGFIPSFIHSIDGSIMRLIVLEINRINPKCIISHLHDSLQFHPNNYPDVIEAINNVYKSDKLNNILERCLFDCMRSEMVEDDVNKLNQMIEDLESVDFNKIDRSDINILGMFPFE